ncbi:MAG: hypothetical protein ABI758_06380, partial [Candidatus Woesebacteria bacterium]
FSIASINVWAGGFAYYNTYGVLLQVAMMALLFLFLEVKKAGYLIIAGVVAALLFFTKQTYGAFFVPAFLLVVVVTDSEHFLYNLKLFLVPLFITSGGILLYFFMQGGLYQFFYDCFLFSKEVKQHAVAFLANRIVFAPLLFVGLRIFFKTQSKNKLGVGALGVLTVLFYFLLKPNRLGRLESYLLDPLFYYHVAIYIIPIFILVSIKWFPRRVRRQVFALSIFTLALFFGSIASGYNDATIQVTSPFFLSLCTFIFSSIEMRCFRRTLSFYLFSGIFFLIFVLPMLIGPIRNVHLVYGVYPMNVLNNQSNLPKLTGLRISAEENKDLTVLTDYFSAPERKNSSILCFPYCPLLNVLLERESNLYFSFFYFETFRRDDQIAQIAQIRENQTDYIVIQEKGSIEPEAHYEDERLKDLEEYVHLHYKPVLQTKNFTVYRKDK